MDKDNKQIAIKWTLSLVLEKSHHQTTHQILQIAKGIQKLSAHQ